MKSCLETLAGWFVSCMCFFLLQWSAPAVAQVPMSEETEACIECHATISPGIVADWKASRHSRVTVAEALKKAVLERRVSSEAIPEKLKAVSVGCAECHTINPGSHKDSFEHNGFDVHIVVSPPDCATCHSVENEEYKENIMSHAYGNLINNPVYHDLFDKVNGISTFDGKTVDTGTADDMTAGDSCLHCHGTRVEVKGMAERETELGEMTFPVLYGWPSQGVGRINPDGSKGACTSCHPRHSFSIEIARKPATCGECHKGPDVPAYKVYAVSKHGNIYASVGTKWNFEAVPWTVGKDFTAPTCATCHASLVVDEEGDVIMQRTHRMNDRIPWRLFGLVYAHPHPLAPDTTRIRNKAGLPLPTEFTGEPAVGFLINEKEMANRQATMERLCFTCHSRQWVDGFYARLENTIKKTNEMTLTATKILLTAWEKGAASGLAQGDSIFNEAIERMWVEQWLFFANSTRFASAMAGADYGAFANGRWYLSKNVRQMADWLEFRLAAIRAGTAKE